MTDTVSRIPRAAVEQIITAALDGMDLKHDTAWVRPPECPCHGRSLSCLSPGSIRCGCDDRRLAQEQRELVCGNGRQPACERTLAVPGAFRCLGHVAEVPTPDEHTVTTATLTSTLPAPDNDGLVSTAEVAPALINVIEARLLPHPYTLRAHALRDRLAAEFERYERAAGLVPGDTGPAVVPAFALKCQWCSGPIPAARGPKARYCRNSHRVSAHKAKKREQLRAANALAATGR